MVSANVRFRPKTDISPNNNRAGKGATFTDRASICRFPLKNQGVETGPPMCEGHLLIICRLFADRVSSWEAGFSNAQAVRPDAAT